MANKEAEKAIKLGYSYNDDVADAIDNLATEHIRDVELSNQLIKTLKLALKNFEKSDNLEPNLTLEDGENTTDGKGLSYGFMGLIQYDGLGLREEAKKNLEKALKINSEIPYLQYTLGYVYADMGNKEEGLKHINKAIELEPDNMAFRKSLDKLENVSQPALKYSSFRGSKKALIIWIGLAIATLIGGFSSDPVLLVWTAIFGAIAFFYWKAKTKK